MATTAIGSVIGGLGLGGSGSGGSGGGSGFLSALGGSLGSELPSFLGNVFGNIANKKQAKKQRKWMENFRGSMYQAAVEDLEKAGLNPLLALGGGPGTGSAPTPSVPRIDFGLDEVGAAAGRFISNAKQSRMLNDQLKIVAANKRAAQADAVVAEGSIRPRLEQFYQQVSRTGAEALLAEDQALQSRANRKLIDTNIHLNELSYPGAEAASRFDATEEGQRLRVFKRFMEALPVIGGTVGGAHIRSR